MTIIKMSDEDRIADATISGVSSVKIIGCFFLYLNNLLIMTETKNPTELGNTFKLLLIKRIIEL